MRQHRGECRPTVLAPEKAVRGRLVNGIRRDAAIGRGASGTWQPVRVDRWGNFVCAVP